MRPAALCCSEEKKQMKVLAACTVLLSLASVVQAQSDAAADFPAKPIRIVVGFTPGGGPDITARHIAQKLGESWKQQVLVENRPGAGSRPAPAVSSFRPASARCG